MIDAEGHLVQFYVVQCETNESPFDLNFDTTPHFDEAIDAEEYAIKMEKETGLNHWWVPVIERENNEK